MITKFKLFEDLIRKPEKDDYVICAHKHWTPTNNEQFLANIGQIWAIDYTQGQTRYRVRYEIEFINPNNNASKMPRDEWVFYKDEILYCSKNKSELVPIAQLYADSNKFGI